MLELIKATPRVEMDVEIHLSLSQLQTFLTCGFRYAHQFLWGTTPESVPMSQIFDRAMNRAVEEYYYEFKETGQILTLVQLMAIFDSTLKDEKNRSEHLLTMGQGESLESFRDMGFQLLRVFHAESKPRNIVDAELPFAVEVPDLVRGGILPIRLTGIFGHIEVDEAGNHQACQFKIASRTDPGLIHDYSLESTVLSYALAQMGLTSSSEPSQIRYEVLCHEEEPSLEHFLVSKSPADHQRLIHLVNEILRAINHRIFYRNQGRRCLDCPFRKACLPE